MFPFKTIGELYLVEMMFATTLEIVDNDQEDARRVSNHGEAPLRNAGISSAVSMRHWIPLQNNVCRGNDRKMYTWDCHWRRWWTPLDSRACRCRQRRPASPDRRDRDSVLSTMDSVLSTVISNFFQRRHGWTARWMTKTSSKDAGQGNERNIIATTNLLPWQSLRETQGMPSV